MAETQAYPLLFTFRDAISGEGFLAGITLSGRALLFKEDDKWWMYGVRPGAIAESGTTTEELLFRFRNRYKEILFDIAGEYNDFEKFKGEVERFFYEPDPEEEHRWEEAVKAIRRGEINPLEILPGLTREAPESRPSQIAVERLDGSKRFTATDNVPDTYVVPVVMGAAA